MVTYSQTFLRLKPTQSTFCRCFFLCLLAFSSLVLTVRGQSGADSSRYLRNLEKFTQAYYSSIKENAPLFNGAEYTGHGQNFLGHPFYRFEYAQNGRIEYEGVWYTGIQIQYDLVDDALVIKDYTGNYFIKLNSQKIRSFQIEDADFINPSLTNKNMPVGFYERLYRGPTEIITKIKKQIVFQTTTEKTISSYKEFKTYYLLKDGEYFEISKKSDILSLLSDKKADIRKMILQNKLNFRKQPAVMLETLARYYDQLKK